MSQTKPTRLPYSEFTGFTSSCARQIRSDKPTSLISTISTPFLIALLLSPYIAYHTTFKQDCEIVDANQDESHEEPSKRWATDCPDFEPELHSRESIIHLICTEYTAEVESPCCSVVHFGTWLMEELYGDYAKGAQIGNL